MGFRCIKLEANRSFIKELNAKPSLNLLHISTRAHAHNHVHTHGELGSCKHAVTAGKCSPLHMLRGVQRHIENGLHVHICTLRIDWRCVMDWIPLIIPGTALSFRSTQRRMRPQLFGHKFPEECLKSKPSA